LEVLMKARIQHMKSLLRTGIIVVEVGLVAACGSVQDTAATMPQPMLEASATQKPPSPTPTVTQTPIPTATPRMPYEDYLSPILPEGAIARLGKGTIYDAALAPDGDSIALATSIGVYRYALDSEANLLQEMWFLPTNMPITSVAFSPDGGTLAAGSYNNYHFPEGAEKLDLGSAYAREPAVLLIDAVAGIPLQVFQQGDHDTDQRISRLVFSRNGNHLAIGSFYGTFMRNLGDFEVLDIPEGTSTIASNESADDVEWWGSLDSLVFSPDGTILVTGLSLIKSNEESGMKEEYEVYVWDLASGDVLSRLTGFKLAVSSLAFSPDGMMLACGTDDGSAELWKTEDWSKTRSLRGSGQPAEYSTIEVLALRSHTSSLEFSPDGSVLATSAFDGTIELWNTTNGSRLKRLTDHSTTIADFIFSADGSELSSISFNGDVLRHDISSGTVAADFELAGHEVTYEVTISGDGQLLARILWEGRVTLHDVEGSSALNSFSGKKPAFSPDGLMLAIAAPNNKIQVWDTTTGEKICGFSGHNDPINKMAFSPDGTLLASGSSDSSIILWDVDSGVRRHRLSGHSDAVYEIVFSPDGKTIASESGDDTIILWDVNSGRQVIKFQESGSNFDLAGFMYDGDYLVGLRIVYPDHDIVLFDPKTGDLIDSIYVEPTTYRVVIAPDNSMLIASTFFYGSQIIPFGLSVDFDYPDEQITGPGIAFSSDGELGAFASFWDVVLWDPASGASIDQFSGHNAEVVDLAFSEETGILASVSYDGTILLWEISR
jgi:WD40 repeat protein